MRNGKYPKKVWSRVQARSGEASNAARQRSCHGCTRPGRARKRAAALGQGVRLRGRQIKRLIGLKRTSRARKSSDSNASWTGSRLRLAQSVARPSGLGRDLLREPGGPLDAGCPAKGTQQTGGDYLGTAANVLNTALRPISWTASSRLLSPINAGWLTSPTSGRQRAGCMWRWCWTCTRAVRWAGP